MQLLLPALSAVMLFLSFPHCISGYLAFIALVPFFHILFRAKKSLTAFVCGFTFGLVHSSILVYPLLYALTVHYNYGILYSSLLLLITAVLPYTLLYGLFSASLQYLNSSSKYLIPLIAPSLWIVADYLREIIPIYLPWAFAGYTQVFTPVIQMSDLTGIYGVSFFVIFVNSLITMQLINRRINLYTPLTAVLVFSVMAYSHFRKNSIEAQMNQVPQSQKIRITAVQGSFLPRERWDTNLSPFRYSTYISLSEKNLPDTDILVWPETVLNSSDKINIEIIKTVSSMLSPEQYFITGATRSGKNREYFNSVFLASSAGIAGIYDKTILFPYTEKSFSGISAGKFFNAPETFVRGSQPAVFISSYGIIGNTICFESIYPYFVRKTKIAGADFIVNTANDSWFGDSSEPYIHLYANIVRAIELRTPVIRCTNNGISAIIDQAGRITGSTSLGTREVLKGSITLSKISSIYLKFGDLILLIAAALILTGIITRSGYSN
jgi:apolipoprotein N-acyltransferase